MATIKDKATHINLTGVLGNGDQIDYAFGIPGETDISASLQRAINESLAMYAPFLSEEAMLMREDNRASWKWYKDPKTGERYMVGLDHED